MYHDTIPTQKSIFEFALRARKITILGALATQFHEISGLGGEAFRSKLRASNVARLKSEPPIAEILNSAGGPYQSVAALIWALDRQMVEFIV
jgi:hypothetical protein